MKRLALVAVLLFCLGGLFVHGWQVRMRTTPPPAYPKHDFSKDKSHRVVRVVDGDTIIISKDGQEVRVRLIGVDTPETVHPRKKVEFYGREASQFTKNLLQGESVWLKYDGTKPTTDKYRRLLAYVHRVPDGLFVNLEIVRQGYGHAYTKYAFNQMELFRKYERQARTSGRGLWGKGQTIRPKKVETTPNKKGKPGQIIVYRTRTGSKYHRPGCRYLSRSKIAISLKEAQRRGLKGCSRCLSPP